MNQSEKAAVRNAKVWQPFPPLPLLAPNFDFAVELCLHQAWNIAIKIVLKHKFPFMGISEMPLPLTEMQYFMLREQI